ncbi:MAG TPA: circularly permuted type 2 ATP-grasp protein [Solirubrobacteraceae bacterium]|jgi:uncharacterized circularly permuted ATP-grasp superfamily protein|nr:circularly permuted type 2 ATP-grasp protein [Solirubrobacteraceae bacterium]
MAYSGTPFDEVAAHRSAYERLFAVLDGVELPALTGSVADELARRGVIFGYGPFVVDPVPRLVEREEWEGLSAGLAQRAQAINRFLLDAYREQRVVDAGLVPGSALDEAEGFEPDLRGRLPQAGWPAAIIGYDIVRDPSGEFLVLEDNVRTPSGFEYAIAAREALRAVLPPGYPEPHPIEATTRRLLEHTLRAAAPADPVAPSIVILTDGPGNVALTEHARAAGRIGAPLVTLDQLIADGSRLRVRLAGGEERDVDVVYRRCDEDRVRDDAGELTEVARTLLPAWLDGNVGVVNAFGNGVADDKLIHSHVEDFIRFYLAEEPLVRSVPTYDLGDPGERRRTLEHLGEHVVKPRHGSGGEGVVIGRTATEQELDRLARAVERHPERYISQPLISLSRHPTVIEGRLVPRHIDLRAFAFCTDEVRLMPGGLSRVALEEGNLVVNSSQTGGGKDTWVVG